MRPLGLRTSRRICTLAPPPKVLKFSAPPVLVARNRIKVDGSFLLLSSASREPNGRRKAWLSPAHQLTRYAIAESKKTTEVSRDIGDAMRLFSQPTRLTNVVQLGTLGNPYFSLKPHLNEMLKACIFTPKGVRGLFEADVVADREVIKKLMFPTQAVFNASFVHGVLFLEDANENPLKFQYSAVHMKVGFQRACTKMYTGRYEPKSSVRHTFHAVVARSLGGLNLLMSGPVDCIKNKYTGNPGCYMDFVTRPLRDGKYFIRPRTWKEWYFRAHLMGVRSLFLGLVDEVGVLQHTRRLATRALPQEVSAEDGAQWDPEKDMSWAARVLSALRDYCQEAADLAEIANTRWDLRNAVWRMEISPVGGEVRVLVRELSREERRGKRLVPMAVLNAFKKGYE
ncbi:hypothetical protein B0H12DRAFT_196879 [Mycena haematopus]|nr:hypothetical protein B0H12DRAFT_196879 [Mycena haematopus]